MPQQSADRLDAGSMALQLGQLVLAGPAPIAVHDDGDMAGQDVEIGCAVPVRVADGLESPPDGVVDAELRPSKRSAGH